MSKQRVVNNGPYIKNGGIIGNGPKATPVDGSWEKGVRQQMAEQAKINEAKSASTTVKQEPKVQPTTTQKKGMTP